MKKCTICKIEKEESEFNKNRIRKDGLNTLCRSCSNERSKKYYSENLLSHRRVTIERKRRNREKSQKLMLEYLSDKVCADCGSKDYRVLEFDHVRKNKSDNVSCLMAHGYSWSKIKSEIDKCEIVCANCHRIRTFIRSKNYRIAV